MPRLKAKIPTKRGIEADPPEFNVLNSPKRRVPRKKSVQFGAAPQENLLIEVSESVLTHKFGEIHIKLPEAFYCRGSVLSLSFQSDSNCLLTWSELDENHESQEKSCPITCDTPYEILLCLAAVKIFRYILPLPSLCSGDNVVHIYLNTSRFVSLDFYSETFVRKYKLIKQTFKLLEYFLNVNLEEENIVADDSIDPLQEAYDCFTNGYNPSCDLPSLSHESLLPSLRPYQIQAVHWMLGQEAQESNLRAELPELFMQLPLLNGTVVTFHKYCGFFTSSNFARPLPCKGGILADEMGLGKTLEVLACILLNPRKKEDYQDKLLYSSNPDESIPHSIPEGDFEFECTCGSEDFLYSDEPLVKCKKCDVYQHPSCVLYRTDFCDDYLCPACWNNSKDLLPSPATLIVSPHSILYQWEQEISRHIKNDKLKVFMYLGVEQQKFVNPKFLANHDIVLTSYETFKKELDYANVKCGKAGLSLRRPKKFLNLPSPLVCIEWWRICLDEAQMVENVFLKTSQMAAKLNSVIHWCVTGTPVQKSVEDLYGLLLFLNFNPYCEKVWWTELLKNPFASGNKAPMISVLKEIAWRTNKAQVLDLIGLPGLKEVVYETNLSPVERVFYEKEHACCRNEFLLKIRKNDSLNTKLKSLDKHVLSKILIPLRTLQLVCCHFQISQGNFVNAQKNQMTTSELLAHLLKTTKYECEDKHRKLIMSMNGLAGVHVIKEDYESAIETYERVLKSVEDNQNIFRTDVTQQIHTLYHLSELLTSKTPDKQSSFSVEQLKEKLNELTEAYNLKDRTAVESSHKNLEAAGEEISSIQKDFKMVNPKFPTSVWWCEALEDMDEASLERLQDILRNAPGKNFFVSETSRFLSFGKAAFLSMLHQSAVDLHDIRSKLRSKVLSLAVEPSVSDVQSAISCHLRPSTKDPPKCKYCEADKLFKQYETKLFQFAKEEEDGIRRGTHAEGDLELALKFILSFCKRSYGLSQYVEDGVNELKLMDALKKEFKLIRSLWILCTDYVSHKDEIEMAKISKRLLLPGETPPNPPVPYILSQIEIQPKLVQYASEIVSYQFELKKKMGQLFYLQNLEKAENIDRPFDECCPICRLTIESSWSVLQCGHSFCLLCIERLQRHTTKFTNALGFTCNGIRCPVCRECTSSKEIYYCSSSKDTQEPDQVQIQGDYSAKVMSILRCLLNISKEEPGAKALVFSSFPDFLYILERALKENNIKCVNLTAKDKRHVNSLLDRFKRSLDDNVLLIPLNFGCNGMNIVEANHVLLLEPVLDPSKHLQAIGRIHRIGQTKLATVHRFIVLETIEENIHTANSSHSNSLSQKSTDTTLRDLKLLFE